MGMTIIYGTPIEVLKLTAAVIREVAFELTKDSKTEPYVATVHLAHLDRRELKHLMNAADCNEATHTLVLTTDCGLSPTRIEELKRDCPFIESFRSARAPFRSARLLH